MATTLLEGANFEISAQGDVARCVVVDRPDVSAEEGARCAGEMQSCLMTEVLGAASYRGLVFDVRRAPAVFGPRTRAALAEMFGHAARSSMRTAVIVSDTAIQRLQFQSLCAECAPRHAAVVTDDAAAEQWLRGGGEAPAPRESGLPDRP